MSRPSSLAAPWSVCLALSLVPLHARAQSGATAPTAAPTPPIATTPAPTQDAASAPTSEAVDLTAPPPTTPAVVDPNENPYIPVYPVRRSGLLLGVTGGLVLTGASGTPIKFSQRDRVTSPGVAVGYGSVFYLGGALTDWFAFHLGGGFSTATKGDSLISGSSFILGVDVWPLFWRGGVFRNLGLGLDFGTGSASIVNKSDENDVRASGAGFSMIRATAFYELPVVWRINLGPALGYEYRSADTYDEHLVTLGLRAVFYGGP